MVNINIYKNHAAHFCGSSQHFSDINISNVWPWYVGQIHREKVCNCYIQWQIWWMKIFSYLMTLVMFVLSLAFVEIFGNQMKCKKFYLENEGQGGEKRD